MAINFSNLPQSNPFVVPAPGFYLFTVSKAEMRQGRDTSKPPYLALSLSLTSMAGQKSGICFDNIFESTAAALLYKLQRFMRAIKLPLEGNVELRDLAKLVVNRSGVVEVENVPDNRYPDDPERKQAQVRLFGSECFWTTEELHLLGGALEQEAAPAPSDTDAPFTFSEADGEVPPADEY